MEILTGKNFDLSKLSYGTPRALDNGGKSIYVAYNGKPLYLQTPKMVSPFGLKTWSKDEKSPTDKLSLELSFKNKSARKSLQTFYDKCEGFDKKIVVDALENSSAWFKKKYSSTDVVEALYTSFLKFPKDKNTGDITDKYPPTIRLTLPQKDGTATCEVYDKDKNRIDINGIETKGAEVTAIIQCLGIWIAGGKFGCSWKVVQLRVTPPANRISGFAFKEDDEKDEESDIEEDDDKPEGSENAEPEEFVEDSDDEPVQPEKAKEASKDVKNVVVKNEVEDEVVSESDSDESDDELENTKSKKTTKVVKVAAVPAAAPRKVKK